MVTAADSLGPLYLLALSSKSFSPPIHPKRLRNRFHGKDDLVRERWRESGPDLLCASIGFLGALHSLSNVHTDESESETRVNTFKSLFFKKLEEQVI